MSGILLQNGKQAFTDANGHPLAGGRVFFYVPNTNTPKDTWQDSAQTILNTNPIILDARGEASIYGSGPYRQVLKDASLVQIWDQFIPDLTQTLQSAINDIYAKSAVQVVNVAAVRLLDKTIYKNAQTAGYYVSGDRGSGNYHLDLSDTTSVDNGGTVIVAADGGRWKLDTEEGVNTAQFGVNGTSATDTARCQAAIDWCLSFAKAMPLTVTGRVFLTASLNIDRPVDTTTSEFRIIADGTDSNFYAETSIEFFSSTIPMPTTSPVSDFVTFENIIFTTNLTSGVPRVLSKKFLRIKFLNCYFRYVRCMISDTYIQSIYFSNCNIRNWESNFLVASHGFDIDMAGCICEHGGGYVFHLINGCYSVRVRGSLIEGSTGGIILTGTARSLSIDSCYFELNTLPSIELNAQFPNDDVSVTNCFFESSAANIANINFYEISWGVTKHAYSSGNRHNNGRLHGNALLPAGYPTAPGMDSFGDSAVVQLHQQPLFVNQANGNWTPGLTVGSPTVSFANVARTGPTAVQASFRLQMPVSASTSPAIINNLPYASNETIFGGRVTLTDQTGEVYLIGGTGAGNGADSRSFAICKNRQGTAYTYAELTNKLVAGVVELSI